MITTADQAKKMYQLLRPNGTPSAAEITATAGKRTYAQFVNDAQAEVAKRDTNWRLQQDELFKLRQAHNDQQAIIRKLSSDDAIDKQQKQEYKELAEKYQTDAAAAQARLQELHDALPTAEPLPEPTEPAKPEASLLARLIALIIRHKK